MKKKKKVINLNIDIALKVYIVNHKRYARRNFPTVIDQKIL